MKQGLKIGIIIVAIVIILGALIIVNIPYSVKIQPTPCGAVQGLCKEASQCSNPLNGIDEEGNTLPATESCDSPDYICCSLT